LNGRDRVVHTTALMCDSSTEPTSQPGKACAAIADYAKHFRRPRSICSPVVPMIGSRYADVSGTVNGKHVSADLQPHEMCYTPKRLINDLYTATNLRGFTQPGKPNGIA
jgi:hypothetical protein